MKLTTDRLINHITWVIDKSGSMSNLTDDVIKVFDNQIKHLAKRSQEMDQETRVSIYLFDDLVECVVYDVDVLRTPSLANVYESGGNTALIDGVIKALDDLDKAPQLYNSHSHLIFCQTDGYENASRVSSAFLRKKIENLPENWTLAILVPSQESVFECKNMGFPANNIQVWSTTKDGIEEAGKIIQKATETFMTNRFLGVKGTKNLFTIDTTKLTKSAIKTKLQELFPTEYECINVYQDSPIKDYVESFLKTPFRVGSAYYQLTKPENIHPYKNVLLFNKKNGKVFGGDQNRQILNLPSFKVKVNPASHPEYDLFIQSTSLNRKLLKGTKVIVLK